MLRTPCRRKTPVATLTLSGLLMVGACTSCSQHGAGSISVPGGKDKFKVVNKAGPFKTKAGPARSTGTAPRKR